MTTDLDTLATALYVKIDDELKVCPDWAPERPAAGIAPTLSDAELLTVAVMGALLGYTFFYGAALGALFGCAGIERSRQRDCSSISRGTHLP